MNAAIPRALGANVLGHSPDWYKLTIVGFLVLNPIVAFTAGWLLVVEFIFTLAMALKGYLLQPGGLLAIEAVVIGLTSADGVYRETEHNFPVILLLIFVVAGIWSLRDMLLYVFGRIRLGVRSKRLLALLFCGAVAFSLCISRRPDRDGHGHCSRWGLLPDLRARGVGSARCRQ